MNRTFVPILFLCSWTLCAAQEVLWRDPGRVEALDFTTGPGGPRMTPKAPFRFVKEDLTGTQPKVEVVDGRGRKWVAKFGKKIHSEPFASRLAWGCGYFVEPTHFVASGRIEGARRLKRASKYIHADGSFEGARFQVRDPNYVFSKTYNWSWGNNPFVGTRQLAGLKILLMLTSNWDNKDATMQDDGPNTGVFVSKTSGRTTYFYSFYDWGNTMGKWGGWPVRRVWDGKGYAVQTDSFVKGVKSGEVRFGYSGKDADDLRRGIRPSDVAWLLRYLRRISDSQFRAGLIASGATPREVAYFVPAIRERITQLSRVAKEE